MVLAAFVDEIVRLSIRWSNCNPPCSDRNAAIPTTDCSSKDDPKGVYFPQR